MLKHLLNIKYVLLPSMLISDGVLLHHKIIKLHKKLCIFILNMYYNTEIFYISGDGKQRGR